METKDKVGKEFNPHDYPLRSAGRVAVSKVPVVTSETTLRDVWLGLQFDAPEYESINYIYVVNKGLLEGVVSIKDVLSGEQDIVIGNIMTTDLVTVRPRTSQERTAHEALRANIKAVPIVDKEGVFLGVVPSDMITEIMYRESVEDMAHLAGVPSMPTYENQADISMWSLVRHRLPWLLIGLVGGLIAANIVGFFEETLTEHLVLASFIPLIMYMGGSSLSQSQSFFIRDLALTPHLNFRAYFIKQVQVTAVIALVLGVVMYAIALFVLPEGSEIAHLLGIALFAVLTSTLLTSFLIPYFFFISKKDPADGSGPLSTIVQDLIGISLYFLIALSLL